MAYKPVYTHDKLRSEALANPETRAIYEATKIQIELSMALKKARKKRKMTQQDVAKLLHTQKPAISRLEAGNSDIRHFPSLLTIAKFATALGYHLTIGLVPMRNIRKKRIDT